MKRFIERHRKSLNRIVVVLVLIALGYCLVALFRGVYLRYERIVAPTPTSVFTAAVTVLPAPTMRPVTLPTGAPMPSPTVQVTDCTWSSAYVADVTIPDGTILEPGSSFTKTWCIENTGTCRWDQVALVFTSGERMNGVSVFVPDAAPGDEVEVSIPMVAPLIPGDYVGVWTICRGNYCFGGVTVVLLVEE